ncbi:hypothetical protein DERP_005965 [Dermatophagoides pteronyssinus]|uniref:Uncharacterized protein n=1 Tax=Dermatophagoides pteronyssinus TaxID=6956 RepID=A0ABQ8JRX8_DERPT|nr:hypothetical protein DERP_005965 [Dermatophagoides pteronyssinus]
MEHYNSNWIDLNHHHHHQSINNHYNYRLYSYLFIIFIGSIINDQQILQQELIIFKYSNPNLIHELFVKSGWPFLTFFLHSSLTFITCAIICKIHYNDNNNNRQSTITNDSCKKTLDIKLRNYIGNKFIRITIFMLLWFLTQEFFDYYQWLTNIDYNGYGSNFSFDISGHIYVLILSNLFLQQESRFLQQYLRQQQQQQQYCQSKIEDDDQDLEEIEMARKSFHFHNNDNGDILCYPDFIQFTNDDDDDRKIVVSTQSFSNMKSLPLSPPLSSSTLSSPSSAASTMNQKMKPISGFNHTCIIINIFIKLISIIWDIILLQTIFFYHTTIEKLLSFIWTICCCHFLNNSFSSSTYKYL